MKKLFFGLVATTLFSISGFANTPTLENEIEVKKENTIETKKELVVCTESCTRVIGGVLYSTTAGNWFTSCETALRRCDAKLDKLSLLQE